MTCYEPGRSKTLFFGLNPKGAKFLESLNLWVRCRRRFFFSRKMAPRFMEALNLWVRCRRRLFFSRNMAPRFPDAAGGAAGAGGGAGRILRSQPDPSPNAPRDQIRRKDPCCDLDQRFVKLVHKCWGPSWQCIHVQRKNISLSLANHSKDEELVHGITC